MVSHTRSVSSRSPAPAAAAPQQSQQRILLARPSRRTTDRTAPTDLRKAEQVQASRAEVGTRHLRSAARGRYRPVRICISPRKSPEPEKFALAEKTTVYYADGTTELSVAANRTAKSSTVRYCRIMGNAIVASEDRSFYTNKGIDLYGIARALYTNLTTGSRQGGSTITQQYAERYYFGRNHVVFRQAEWKRSRPSRSRRHKIRARCYAIT